MGLCSSKKNSPFLSQLLREIFQDLHSVQEPNYESNREESEQLKSLIKQKTSGLIDYLQNNQQQIINILFKVKTKICKQQSILLYLNVSIFLQILIQNLQMIKELNIGKQNYEKNCLNIQVQSLMIQIFDILLEYQSQKNNDYLYEQIILCLIQYFEIKQNKITPEQFSQFLKYVQPYLNLNGPFQIKFLTYNFLYNLSFQIQITSSLQLQLIVNEQIMIQIKNLPNWIQKDPNAKQYFLNLIEITSKITIQSNEFNKCISIQLISFFNKKLWAIEFKIYKEIFQNFYQAAINQNSSNYQIFILNNLIQSYKTFIDTNNKQDIVELNDVNIDFIDRNSQNKNDSILIKIVKLIKKLIDMNSTYFVQTSYIDIIIEYIQILNNLEKIKGTLMKPMVQQFLQNFLKQYDRIETHFYIFQQLIKSSEKSQDSFFLLQFISFFQKQNVPLQQDYQELYLSTIQLKNKIQQCDFISELLQITTNDKENYKEIEQKNYTYIISNDSIQLILTDVLNNVNDYNNNLIFFQSLTGMIQKIFQQKGKSFISVALEFALKLIQVDSSAQKISNYISAQKQIKFIYIYIRNSDSKLNSFYSAKNSNIQNEKISFSFIQNCKVLTSLIIQYEINKINQYDSHSFKIYLDNILIQKNLFDVILGFQQIESLNNSNLQARLFNENMINPKYIMEMLNINFRIQNIFSNDEQSIQQNVSDKYFDEESISINESLISNYSDRILNKISTFVAENYDLQVTQFTTNRVNKEGLQKLIQI